MDVKSNNGIIIYKVTVNSVAFNICSHKGHSKHNKI